ncbi:hypothetical protein niasHT_035119 [Heterodera trifolii]|uniref:Uncharacterized protein n=1 Tax=Heterodera trifolii TaxID=157864 RepID=A0ABD2IHA2_9BILA
MLNAQQTDAAPTQTAQLPALSNVECFGLDDQSGKNIFDFSETSAQLKSLFAKPQSVWIDRYECLRATKQDDDFRAFVNRHKRLLRDFEFQKLNEEQFNCLMLLIALKSPKDAELRKRILGKIIQKYNMATLAGTHIRMIREVSWVRVPPWVDLLHFRTAEKYNNCETEWCISKEGVTVWCT